MVMDTTRIIESSEEKTVFEIKNDTGKARLISYPVYPGIDILYIDAHMQKFNTWNHPVIPDLFAVNHCEEGRVECAFRNGKYLYMGQGDMSIGWRYNGDYHHSVFFPSSRYLGLSIMISVPKAQPVIDRLLGQDKSDRLMELHSRLAAAIRTKDAAAAVAAETESNTLMCEWHLSWLQAQEAEAMKP